MSDVLALAAVYATQWLAGRLVLAALDDGPPRRRSERLARALLLGPAALAVQMLLFHVVGVRFALPAILLPWWIAGGCALLVRRRAGAREPAARPAAGGWHAAALGLAVALSLLTLAGGLLLPVHSNDAMNNFALLARVYETHGNLAPDAVRALAMPGHVDYPPLTALNEAALFLATDGDRGLAIKPFFALAHLALLLLIVEACFGALRPRAAALAAAFALLVPVPGLMAMDGFADVSLAAAVLLLALQGRELWCRPTPRGALLYAACAATCALTKFEGLAIALPALLLPVLASVRGARRPAGEAAPRLHLGASAAAALLGAGLSLAWPLYLATHHLGDPPMLTDKWHDLSRTLARWPGVARRIVALVSADDTNGHMAWGLFWPTCVAAAALGLLRRPARRGVVVASALLLAHLALYVTVFACSPDDVAWHVDSAGPRLLLHAMPWALLAALGGLAATPGPEDGTPPA